MCKDSAQRVGGGVPPAVGGQLVKQLVLVQKLHQSAVGTVGYGAVRHTHSQPAGKIPPDTRQKRREIPFTVQKNVIGDKLLLLPQGEGGRRVDRQNEVCLSTGLGRQTACRQQMELHRLADAAVHRRESGCAPARWTNPHRPAARCGNPHG